MLKISYDQSALISIDTYVKGYRSYHENLYQDSGIWNEQKIIKLYTDESVERYNQILDTITERLENPVISYVDNEAIIKWRTKILIVNFKDEGETRIITDISIR